MRFAPFDIPRPARCYPCLTCGGATLLPQSRILPEETPIALVYGGSTEAVMMATPSDLEDFAVGFSFTEGLIKAPEEIAELAMIIGEFGIELRMWLNERSESAYRRRRRQLVGPTGCGLCGIESLAEAARPVRRVADGPGFAEHDIVQGLAALTAAQSLNRETHATHAACFYRRSTGDVIVREDVGRHNALDKLAGALCRGGVATEEGAIVITSRVSVEMVQKAAAIGTPILIAMSAPTALAVRTAQAANITLIAVARGDSYQVFCHAHRIGREWRGAKPGPALAQAHCVLDGG